MDHYHQLTFNCKGETHVAISTMLSSWDRPSPLSVYFLSDAIIQLLTNIGAFGLRGQCNDRNSIGMLVDQLLFALVPSCKQFCRRRGSNEARVRDSRKANARNVSGGSVYALIVVG